MAYTYKSIGSSAAAVVSLLAVGTVLWFQRAPGPINAPRPQDEAEVMTAILEKHYAMKRPWVGYWASYAENVSSVPDTNVPGGVRYVTNSLAYTTTNTIGFFPNAPFRLASGIRAAFLGSDTTAGFSGWGYGRSGDINLQLWYIPGYGGLDYTPPQAYLDDDPYNPMWLGANHEVGWIIPEDSYMQTGDTSWFGDMAHTNVFGGPLNYWEAPWYAFPSEYFGESWEDFANKWFARSQFVWTNYVSKCDSTWRTTTNYETLYVTNRVIGGVINTITNKTFSTTNYVATGKVNTYVQGISYYGYFTLECASMMFPFERDTPGITRVDASRWSGFNGEPAGKYSPAFWTTNVYHDMGRALSLLQWIREYQTPCELVTWSATYTNGIFSSLTVATNFSTGVAGVSGSESPVNNRITVVGTVAKYAITNDRPFTIDHVHFTPDGISFANGITAATWGSNPPPISVVAPYESATTDWWPMTPDEMRTWVDDTAAGIEYGVDPIPEMSISMPCVAFHVQFSALTNYLDHAPAR